MMLERQMCMESKETNKAQKSSQFVELDVSGGIIKGFP